MPDYIHWDTWLGSSPVYPYNGVYFYSGNWRCFNMFGAGGLGDMGCHTFNMAVYVLDLDWPSEIQVVSDRAYQYSYPENGFELIYTFAATDKRGPVKLRYFCGGHKPPHPEQLEPAREMGSNMGGSILFGSKQTLMTDSHCKRSVIIPEANRRAIVEDLKQYRPQNFGRGTHYGNWMQALKGEGTCRSNFQYASRLTEIVLLGDIASRLNRTLKLDPATRTIIGDEQAQAMMIAAPARDGWAL